jgi:hypothetical protein
MKYKIELPHELYDEIKEYTDTNDLDISLFLIEIVKTGYMVKKYDENIILKKSIQEDSIVLKKNNKKNNSLYD